ncbi:MAG: outer membrane beta-barrel protein [Rubricoccaceae bacterium]|nr:outer membrane beta-barrel protein [Rubricoccaceae bacterium]
MLRFRLLALAAALAWAPAASAQLIPTVDLGVTGGLNFSNLGDAATADLSGSTGYHIGVYADVGVAGVAVRPAVLYVRSGDLDFSAVPLLGDLFGAEETVSFIAIPVDLKFAASTPLVQPYGLLGPELRVPLGEVFDRDGARNVAVALNVGAGARLGTFIGPSASLELRYSFDVTGFVDDAAAYGLEAGADESFRFNVFYVRLGVAI